MHRKFAQVVILIAAALPSMGLGAEWFVSPAGATSGDGSKNRPWDLATALAHPSVVQPGDTIWLRGGVYSSSPKEYSSKLTGTNDKPIVVRQYAGERATVNGNIAIHAPYTWYWGFEVTNTSGARKAGQVLLECMDTYAGSVGVKLINLVLHDCDQGIGFWVDAVNAEAYGNIIYYVGQAGPTRGLGHAIYTQNKTGTKKITDNIMFDAFDIGFQAYGSEAAFVQNYELEGNIVFNSGALYGVHVDNILFEGGAGVDNITIENTFTYHTPSAGTGYSRIGSEFSKSNGSLVSKNNYWIGGEQAVQIWGFQKLIGSGNVAYSPKGLMLLLSSGSLPRANYSWDDNTYFGSGLLRLNGSNEGFKDWNATAYLDAHSRFTVGRPTGNWSFVRPNRYEKGRANIVVYNWDGRPAVDVDLKGVLTQGQMFEIRDAQDLFGKPLVRGEYHGLPVALPMNSIAVSQPIGEVRVPPVHTSIEFGVFVVVGT